MKPQYIDPNCPKCKLPLVPAKTVEPEAWDDEWVCATCYDGDGVWIDFHPEDKAELDRRIQEIEDGTVETIPWEEVRNRLYKKIGLSDKEIEEKIKEIKKKAEEEIDSEPLYNKRILNFDE